VGGGRGQGGWRHRVNARDALNACVCVCVGTAGGSPHEVKKWAAGEAKVGGAGWGQPTVCVWAGGENRRAVAEVKKWVADEAKVGGWVGGWVCLCVGGWGGAGRCVMGGGGGSQG
jgi:hypothetical protein